VSDWESWVQPVGRVARGLGLQPRDCLWDELPVDALYRVAAYMLPEMYAHWSKGRDVWRMRQRFETGEEHLYEMVVNTRPARAYLLDHNNLGEQVFVMAHVQGHLDFFERNGHLSQARTDMVPLLREASARFRSYEDEQGVEAVERIIEVAQALSWHCCEVREREPGSRRAKAPEPDYPLRDLDELFAERPKPAPEPEGAWKRGWSLPCPDPLWFLARYAPLEPWERDIVQVVREVGLHLLPQARTKVMNEGWAVYWGLRVLSALDLPAEVNLIASRLHAQVASPHPLRLNPYWLGWRLWEHLAANGEDIFALCAMESDSSFLRNWIDADFVRKEELYVWGEVSLPDQGQAYRVKTRDWEVVRDRLSDLAVLPIPYVRVEDVGADRGLQLRCDQGALEESEARDIVRGIGRLWRGSVELQAGPGAVQRITCRAGEGE
jgi:stage V sporulation protein R